MQEQESVQGSVEYGPYLLVWFGLVILTGLTVTLAGVDLGRFSIYAVLLIAALKSSMVLYIFMHLKHESNLVKLIFFITVIALAIFIGFTFFDVSYRQG